MIYQNLLISTYSCPSQCDVTGLTQNNITLWRNGIRHIMMFFIAVVCGRSLLNTICSVYVVRCHYVVFVCLFGWFVCLFVCLYYCCQYDVLLIIDLRVWFLLCVLYYIMCSIWFELNWIELNWPTAWRYLCWLILLICFCVLNCSGATEQGIIGWRGGRSLHGEFFRPCWAPFVLCMLFDVTMLCLFCLFNCCQYNLLLIIDLRVWFLLCVLCYIICCKKKRQCAVLSPNRTKGLCKCVRGCHSTVPIRAHGQPHFRVFLFAFWCTSISINLSFFLCTDGKLVS